MVVREIKSIHDVVLAYKKGQQLINITNNKFRRIIGFVEGTNEILLEIPSVKQPLCVDLEMCKRSYKIVISNNKENKMEGYIERMIQEHKELVPRIQKLHNWVHGDAYKQVDATEFANECIQLKGMKIYEEALRARLTNAGVIFDNGDYLISIDSVEDEEETPADND